MKLKFFCHECETTYTQWMGLCHHCQNWNSIFDYPKLNAGAITNFNYKKIDSLDVKKLNYIPTFSNEFNQVLGGGLINDGIYLLSGRPGTGKSTLLYQTAKILTSSNRFKLLYVSCEEGIQQVTRKFDLQKTDDCQLYITTETDIDNILTLSTFEKFNFVFIDSLQMLTNESNGIYSFHTSSAKIFMKKILDYAKKTNTCFILISQQVKNGTLAGPKYVEHMVDVVISLNKSRTHKNLIKIFTTKNRFGSSLNLGFIKFKDNKLLDWDFNKEYQFKKNINHPGFINSCSLFFNKLFFVQIESVIIQNKTNSNKIYSNNFCQKKIKVLLGLIEKYLNISFKDHDIYLNCYGHFEDENSLFLPLAASLLSSFYNKTINPKWILLGELNFCGDVIPIEINGKDNNDYIFCGNIISKNLLNPYLIRNIYELNQLFK